MNKYKIYKKYENSSVLTFDEIEAETLGKAEKRCNEILKENIKKHSDLQEKNIYTSKLIECKLLRFKGFFNIN
jgi:hypothetical protein